MYIVYCCKAVQHGVSLALSSALVFLVQAFIVDLFFTTQFGG